MVKEKWNPMERNNNVDKDTERWVEEQNAYFEKKREKQSDEVPARFDPKGPVTILQRRHYASVPMSGQMPQRLKDISMPKASLIIGRQDMKGLGTEKNLGQDITPKVGNGLKEMAIGKEGDR